ncbi:MAG: SRPBCC domain-containing protein [Crocosphaera sp.]
MLKLFEAKAISTDNPSTVVVTFVTNLPEITVWQALTEPSRLAQWFAESTTSLNLCSQGHNRFDFGDGDFFEVTNINSPFPFCLEYDWRFLGISPLAHIVWQIIPQGNETLVSVTDTQANRSLEETLELQKGWIDFSERLAQFLKTNQSTRYDWRREIDGSIELACDPKTALAILFSPEKQVQWLPLTPTEIDTNHHLTLTHQSPLASCQVIEPVWQTRTQLSFHLFHSNWLNPTHCFLKLVPYNHQTMLVINHSNWEEISLDSDYQLEQRKGFCKIWIKTLQNAQKTINLETQTLQGELYVTN